MRCSWGGKIAIHKKEILSDDDGVNVFSKEVDNYPNVPFFVDRRRQTFYVHKGIETVFGFRISGVASMLEAVFSGIVGERYSVNVKVLPARGFFWETVGGMNSIRRVEFDFVAPNIEGATEASLREGLLGYKESYNITNYKESLKNKDGNLRVPKNDFFSARASTIENAGGVWVVEGDGRIVKSNDSYQISGDNEIVKLHGEAILQRILEEQGRDRND